MPTARVGERRQNFEHAAGAGAEIEHGVERGGPDRLEDRRLDALLGEMQGAHFVPIGGMRGEIAGRLIGARLAHFDEPRAVGRRDGGRRVRAGRRCRGRSPPPARSG